jgi:hypothetical protein
METNKEKKSDNNVQMMAGLKNVVYAQAPDKGIIIGVVTNSKPSSLALLAAGVAGTAERRARREQAK